jgi:hypothetical protein
VIVPGRPLSTGGCEERAAGRIIDSAYGFDVMAAAARTDPAAFERLASVATGLRIAVGVIFGIEQHEVDALYALRFGALVREVQGRPTGNATGRPPDPIPDTAPLPLEMTR